MKKNTTIALIVIFGVLLFDQALKLWVKTHMQLGEHIDLIGDRVMLYFVENPGMAFGMELGGSWGKLLLSIFRMAAITALSFYLTSLIRKGATRFLIVCISLVIAGAAGNLIDSAFYGLIFNDSVGKVAEFMPDAGGYAGFLHGNVVDMFYCPIIRSTFPAWMPGVGGNDFIFFSPVFNIADSAITVSVLLMLIFYKKVFGIKSSKHKKH